MRLSHYPDNAYMAMQNLYQRLYGDAEPVSTHVLATSCQLADTCSSVCCPTVIL